MVGPTKGYKMKNVPFILSMAILVGLFAFASGCGHQPKTIRSARSIALTPASETMVAVNGLPLEDWPKLAKFGNLQHFTFSPAETTDAHLAALGALRFPALRQIYLPHASKVTDAGLAHLAYLPSLQGLQLIGTGITDKSLAAFATSFPALTGINVEECDRLTAAGFLALAQSPTLVEVSLSLDPLTPADVERIIQTATNVTWWFIRDSRDQLDLGSLAHLAEKQRIRISVLDKNNRARSVSNSQPDAAQ